LFTYRPQTSKNLKYEHGFLGNYQRKGIGISDSDSVERGYSETMKDREMGLETVKDREWGYQI